VWLILEEVSHWNWIALDGRFASSQGEHGLHPKMCPLGGAPMEVSGEQGDEWFYNGSICSVPSAVLTKMKGAVGKGKPPS